MKFPSNLIYDGKLFVKWAHDGQGSTAAHGALILDGDNFQ